MNSLDFNRIFDFVLVDHFFEVAAALLIIVGIWWW